MSFFQELALYCRWEFQGASDRHMCHQHTGLSVAALGLVFFFKAPLTHGILGCKRVWEPQ